MQIDPTDTPEVQVAKQVQQQEWKKAKIAAFNQNLEKKTGNFDIHFLFNSFSLVMVSSSSGDIPVAYQPPEFIPDSQPESNQFDKDVQILAGPPARKNKVANENKKDVESEDDNSQDEEEEKETDQYLSKFQENKETVTVQEKIKRRRIIPKRPCKSLI